MQAWVKRSAKEVPGHELAHIVRLLTDPDYRRLYWERQTLADTRSNDIQLLRRLIRSIEKPAEAAEVEVWREVMGGKEPRM